MTISYNGVQDLSGNGKSAASRKHAVKLSGSFGATGVSDAVLLHGLNNIEINFGEGSVTLQRSLDNGTTFVDVTLPDGTSPATFTADASFMIDAGAGMLFRLNCTAYTSTITYKVA